MLRGKVAIITGGARGIGRYIAQGFAGEGARVAIADVDAARLDQTAAELRATGREVLAVPTDVRDEDAVRGLMARVADHFGQIDVLVNNAAIVPHLNWGGPGWPLIRDMDRAFWDRVIETNLGGAFLCTKHVLPYLEARRTGHIINLHGGGNRPGACAYVVTKDALVAFTRMVAEEVRPAGVCVVILSPGAAIATEDAPEEARQRMPGPEFAGNRFLLAAEAPLALSGHLLRLRDGRLEIEA